MITYVNAAYASKITCSTRKNDRVAQHHAETFTHRYKLPLPEKLLRSPLKQ